LLLMMLLLMLLMWVVLSAASDYHLPVDGTASDADASLLADVRLHSSDVFRIRVRYHSSHSTHSSVHAIPPSAFPSFQ